MKRSRSLFSRKRSDANPETVEADGTQPNPSGDDELSLLAALRNMVIPLVQKAVPKAKDLHKVPLEREAEDLLTALQKYISKIISDRSHLESSQGGITRTVEFEEEGLKVQAVNEVRSEEPEQSHYSKNEDTVQMHIDSPTSSLRSLSSNDLEELALERRHAQNSRLKEKFLTFLRGHVFNDMPMRLLHFRKLDDSKLNITLLDRAGLYSYLATKLTNDTNDVISKYSKPDVDPDAISVETMSNWISDIASYAILSHTWLRSAPGEVTYDEWDRGVFDLSHAGYRKLANFCKVAAEDHNLTLGWMDTVCIDKSSSSELDEAIRSMYKWYRKAKICITYLAETTEILKMSYDPWFTRGWTLQELLAPNYIKFYSTSWKQISESPANDKKDHYILSQIQKATNITQMDLTYHSEAPVSRKMQWAATRQVTRGEDTAYSLMGVFNVNMSIAYGEGAELAFIRLIKEILSTAKSEVFDIFNWAGGYTTSTSVLIPSSPRTYMKRSDEFRLHEQTLIEPITLTHLGLRMPVLLLHATPTSRFNPKYTPVGDYFASVQIFPHTLNPRFHCDYNLLDSKAFDGDDPNMLYYCLSFAVLNCRVDESHIFVPAECLAVALNYSYTGGTRGAITPLGVNSKVPTKDPIVFQLRTRTSGFRYDPRSYYTVNREDLARHGMQFLHIYM